MHSFNPKNAIPVKKSCLSQHNWEPPHRSLATRCHNKNQCIGWSWYKVGPPNDSVQLVQITPITMVHGTYNYSSHGGYKPSNITGGPTLYGLEIEWIGPVNQPFSETHKIWVKNLVACLCVMEKLQTFAPERKCLIVLASSRWLTDWPQKWIKNAANKVEDKAKHIMCVF